MIGLVYLNNTRHLAKSPDRRPFLVAHRGLAQEFDRNGLTNETCTAARMIPTSHTYLENTIASMEAAFRFGADVVEFDVHPTTDEKFAVFHDWTLDCRTEGTGVTREHSLAELQKLDIGYGYTADGGKTWPFRGKGKGLMPSLDEVLDTFPDRSFVINIKSDDPSEGKLLAQRLAEKAGDRTGEIMVYGGRRPVEEVCQALPEIRSISRKTLKKGLIRYLLVGWTGYVPQDCRNKILVIPSNYTAGLWGWPNRFLQRMEKAGSKVGHHRRTPRRRAFQRVQ